MGDTMHPQMFVDEVNFEQVILQPIGARSILARFVSFFQEDRLSLENHR